MRCNNKSLEELYNKRKIRTGYFRRLRSKYINRRTSKYINRRTSKYINERFENRSYVIRGKFNENKPPPDNYVLGFGLPMIHHEQVLSEVLPRITLYDIHSNVRTLSVRAVVTYSISDGTYAYNFVTNKFDKLPLGRPGPDYLLYNRIFVQPTGTINIDTPIKFTNNEMNTFLTSQKKINTHIDLLFVIDGDLVNRNLSPAVINQYIATYTTPK